MPLQGLPLQNNQGTVKIIMSHILHYYIIISIVSVHMPVHYFHVPYPITFIRHVLLHFTDLNLSILSNNTNKKKNIVYYVPFKWKLPSPAPISDFRMAVPKNDKKKNGHFILQPYLIVNSVFLYVCPCRFLLFVHQTHNKDPYRVLTIVFKR
jgi:hypothetical protein